MSDFAQRRKLIEKRLEIHRRIDGVRRELKGWHDRDEPLPRNTPADTQTLFTEALEVLERLQQLVSRDVDDAIQDGSVP